MYNVHPEDFKKRTMIVYYFSCPACGDEIDDIDCSLTDGVIECPHCNNEILIGNICKED